MRLASLGRLLPCKQLERMRLRQSTEHSKDRDIAGRETETDTDTDTQRDERREGRREKGKSERISCNLVIPLVFEVIKANKWLWAEKHL